MEKYIHYCWFGNNKLDKLAQKCIKSWKKYLPDYEIILWNEDNFDVNSTPFSKSAYEQKKWAFVSDVARVYALKKFGGIYFDTDMMIKKDVSEIVQHDFFAGWETKDNVAVGVLGAVKGHPIIDKLYKYYSSTAYDEKDVYGQTIPKLLTKILRSTYKLQPNHMVNQFLDDGVAIYANDYFYPITADRGDDLFTENTCMVHYYKGSWLPAAQRHYNRVYSILGADLANAYFGWKCSCKTFLKSTARLALYPLVSLRRKSRRKSKQRGMIQEFDEAYALTKKSDYIVFYNYNWLGTSISTKELFENSCGIDELSEDAVIEHIADTLIRDQYRLIAFSAFSLGWDKLIECLRKKGYDGIIKVIWHGSHCMNIEHYDWTVFSWLIQAVNRGAINRLCFVKKSMYEFYKAKGYSVEFIKNTVRIDPKLKKKIKNNVLTKQSDRSCTLIGVYASGDRWVKNFYNQLCAASLVENALVECSPLNEKTRDFAEMINLEVVGNSKPVEREVLFEKMARNDINLYATFTECAPLIPLESFELGVPCITADNHHYWEGHELRDYLVVDSTDDVYKIYEKINFCLNNKEKIMDLYQSWKEEYDKEVQQSVDDFLTKF